MWLRRGQLLLADRNRDANEAELCMEKSLALARQEGTKLRELLTATALAQPWQRQGRRAEALQLLGPLYAWFTEGFEYPELRSARILLNDLSKTG
jgi:predicted ATPase